MSYIWGRALYLSFVHPSWPWSYPRMVMVYRWTVLAAVELQLLRILKRLELLSILTSRDWTDKRVPPSLL